MSYELERRKDVLTVADVLGLPQFSEFRLVGGETGVGREIRCVTVHDAPYSHKWLRGGEFVLTSGYSIRVGAVTPHEWFQATYDQRVAALGVMESFFDVASKAFWEWAFAQDLPIISIPAAMTWAEVMQPIYAAIGSYEDRVQRPPSTSKLAHYLAQTEQLTGQTWVFIDRDGYVKTTNLRNCVDLTRVELGPALRTLAPDDVQSHNMLGAPYLVSPLVDQGNYLGFIATTHSSRANADLISTVKRFLLDCLHEGGLMEETARQFRLNLLYDLSNPGRALAGDLIWRADRLGCNLRSRFLVFTVGLDAAITPLPSLDLAAIVRRSILEADCKGIAEEQNGEVVAVVEAGAVPTRSQTALRVALSIHQRIAQAVRPLTVTIGMSRPRELRTAELGFKESYTALTLGRRLWGVNKVIPYDRLGLFCLLDQLPDDPFVTDFYAETMGVLERDGELLRTLQTFLDSRFNVSECARKLFLHLNTVKYRLKKVETLTGLSLGDTEHCLRLQIALKIRQLRMFVEVEH